MPKSMIKKIEEVLDRDVRPYLNSHDGDVVIIEYAKHVLKIRMTGMCSGCPSATLTTEELIASKVKAAIPQVEDVVLVTGVSDDLIDQAKAILNHNFPQ